MLPENTRLLLRLYYRPHSAMSEIIDRGSWLYGAVAVIAISVLLQYSVTSRLYNAYQAVVVAQHHTAPPKESPASASEDEPRVKRSPVPVVGRFGWWFVSFSPTAVLATAFSLALLYVPFTILLVASFEHLGSFTVVLRRDYAALLACTFMAWAAAHLPIALVGVGLVALRTNVHYVLGLWILSKVAFAGLMVFALRAVFGAGFGRAVSTVSIAWTSTVLESYLAWLASPFVLYWGYMYFRGDVGDVFAAFRTRQSFRRYLEAATLNPRDSDAHYQLGLIHQQRHQYAEATERFKRAVEIDPGELDAHYQLGRIAQAQSRFEEALEHFQAIVKQDNDHAQGEVWRAIGAAYAATSRNAEARAALERYVERRPYDPVGLYYFGETLTKLGETQQAREAFERCVEAEKTNPYRRDRQLRKWRKLAEKQLRSLRA